VNSQARNGNGPFEENPGFGLQKGWANRSLVVKVQTCVKVDNVGFLKAHSGWSESSPFRCFQNIWP